MVQRQSRRGALVFATMFVGIAVAKVAMAWWAPLRDQIRWTSADTWITLGSLLLAATMVARAYRPALAKPLTIAAVIVLIAGAVAVIRLFP